MTPEFVTLVLRIWRYENKLDTVSGVCVVLVVGAERGLLGRCPIAVHLIQLCMVLELSFMLSRNTNRESPKNDLA